MAKYYRIKATAPHGNVMGPYLKGKPGQAQWARKHESTLYSPQDAFTQLGFLNRAAKGLGWELEAANE